MKIMIQKLNLIFLSFVVLLSINTASFAASEDEIFTNWRGLAIRGYDPVAYFTLNKAVEGSSKYELRWKEAKWRFSTQEHKELFEANPEQYAPQYGGYCAWAVAEGYTASVDPQNAWRIVDGKLYLNFSVGVQKQWERDIPRNIKRANKNWPGVLK